MGKEKFAAGCGFEVIPAIDLMGGICVRLQQGDASRKTEYSTSPADVAAGYGAAGAKRIHVVDLDGAFEGSPRNLDSVRAIRAATSARVEVGGGIRDERTLEVLFDAGVDFAVIGTKALEDPAFLAGAVRRFGERIIVGADARNGYLSTRGWTTTTEVCAIPFLRNLRETTGIRTVIYTDIARDGMFSSPNFEALDEVLAIPGIEVIASGGVGSVSDIRSLRALNKQNLTGVIVGKALYDGRVSLSEAIAATLPDRG